MPDPITGLVVGGASLIGGQMQARSARQAAQTQAGAAQAGIDEQRAQFERVQQLLSPYTQAGEGSLQGQQALLGLLGPEAERQAIAGIEGSPTFGALARQGEEAILQRASATGGLRGGNVQAALAQFRPAMLQSLIEKQYANLAGLTTLGQRSAAGLGGAGTEMGVNVANLYGQQGQATAGGQLATGQANAQLFNLPGQALGFSRGFGGQAAAPTSIRQFSGGYTPMFNSDVGDLSMQGVF